MARPRITVDFDMVMHMCDIDKIGWSRMAEIYRKMSGQYISRETIKRRYSKLNFYKHLTLPLIQKSRCLNLLTLALRYLAE